MLSMSELMNWLLSPETWAGRYGLWNLLGEHLWLTSLSILIAAIIALPIGIAIGHFGKGEVLVIGLSSLSRAIPTMGLLFALVMLAGVEAKSVAVVFALVVISIPPLLAGAHSGIRAIPRAITDAAIAQGMTGSQLLKHVELPIAAASIIGGFRVAYIQVISTIVLAPLVGLGGLGFGIIQGLALRNFAQVTGSGLVIVLLTVLGDQLIGKLQRVSAVTLGNSTQSRY